MFWVAGRDEEAMLLSVSETGWLQSGYRVFHDMQLLEAISQKTKLSQKRQNFFRGFRRFFASASVSVL